MSAYCFLDVLEVTDPEKLAKYRDVSSPQSSNMVDVTSASVVNVRSCGLLVARPDREPLGDSLCRRRMLRQAAGRSLGSCRERASRGCRTSWLRMHLKPGSSYRSFRSGGRRSSSCGRTTSSTPVADMRCRRSREVRRREPYDTRVSRTVLRGLRLKYRSLLTFLRSWCASA
jgi:hypothetical protein